MPSLPSHGRLTVLQRHTRSTHRVPMGCVRLAACSVALLALTLVAGCNPEAEGSGSQATAAARPVADAAPKAADSATARPTTERPSPARTTPAAAPKATSPSKKPVASGLVAVVGVTDGDTIKVRLAGKTERVRVIGIDTPELRSHDCYAQQAASRMQSLVQSKQVKLVADPTQDDRDRYGRLLRHVRLADGRSVAELLIAGGFGREYTYDVAYVGQAAHLKAQAAAKSAHRGIWSSGCLATVSPAPAPKAVAPSAPAAAPKSCLIKGNIASDGEKIYHVPGGAFYDVTKISESKGERWFCTESEALNAGWRPSKR